MKRYDVKCPVCGTVNKELYLDETDGWMECEHCHNDVQLFLSPKLKAIPRYANAICHARQSAG